MLSIRWLGLAGFVVATLALTAWEPAFAQKKGVPIATPEDYAALLEHKEVNGTLVGLDADGGSMVVRVEIPRLEPNPNYRPPKNPNAAGANNALQRQIQQLQRQQIQRQQSILRRQQQIMRTRNPQQRARAMQQLQFEMARFQQQQTQAFMRLMTQQARAMQGKKAPAQNANNVPFRVVTSYKEFDLKVQPNVKIRRMFLPLEFDDLGNFKQYTEKEKAALRGPDPKKPGYMASADEAMAGTEVRLALVSPAKAKAGPGDDPFDLGNRPVVRTILLTKAGSGDSLQGARKK